VWGLSRRITWSLLGVVIALVLVCAAYVFREPVLIALAEAWIVDEALIEGDAIVVLGGGLETRPFAAADLYHRGYAPRVLVSDTAVSSATEMGLTPSESDLMKQVLIVKGVPEAAIVSVGTGSASTYDEAVAVGEWARRSGAEVVVIPTELFHTRRVDWWFEKTLEGVDVRVSALEPARYTRRDWWRNEHGLVDFQNEVVKFAYYLVRY
jgi:uncharacterized SAM-binding protein YcdF (DUF218 family)